MDTNLNSTRVKAPASSKFTRLPPRLSSVAAGAVTSHFLSPPRLSPGPMKCSDQTHGTALEVTGQITGVASRMPWLSSLNLRSRIRIACWNVLTLSDIGYQTALALVLGAYNIEIACLSETRLPGSGLYKVGAYTLIHSGGCTRVGGVAVMLSARAAVALVSWRAVSDRILVVRLKHSHGHLSVISVYAPTEATDADVKDQFYTSLLGAISSVPPHDKLIVAGDFNAVSGSDRSVFGSVVGPFGSGSVGNNDNSLRFLTLCLH